MTPSPISDYAHRRATWLRAFDSQQVNSITNQCRWMMLLAVGFRVLNKAREISTRAHAPHSALNPLTLLLLDRGFFPTQLIAVRRLGDAKRLNGQSGVYSLMSVLKDISSSRTLFTRGAILSAEDLVYDYRPAISRSNENAAALRRGNSAPS